MTKRQLPLVHPGEILQEEFLTPMNLTGRALAFALFVTPARISQIINKKRSVTADTALRLARYFGTTAQFWLNLQTQYDLGLAKENMAGSLKWIKPRKG
ncbi:HigA family addiction module antitoxin [Stenotrophomonas sp. GD03657]|uniref:HigA family addiction module antitoxin n=1 Tax=Stenotrophomonas sp. GD03657 TaxID=2975363 RepID=UPI00244C0670|nr:HigA family addiction module antitoxin [Stenotrophomonas sp. GD03657]MDH2154182.1 HigA family addiction module antitoxin [Stenotrophomonas sp. GD03657]